MRPSEAKGRGFDPRQPHHWTAERRARSAEAVFRQIHAEPSSQNIELRLADVDTAFQH
jgi:hypothetical protein